MARYQLPQYQSTYRNTGSVEVNQMLRDRYAKAMVADDALTASVDGMQSADYEGDNQLKNELAEEYNAKLDERARRGDYETAGMSITRDSRSFIKGYQPIKQNFDRVQAYQAEQKKKRDDGVISEEVYKHSMHMSNKDYNGLQKNEDGSINDNSYFSGYGTVKSVDIATEFDEVMKGYAAKHGSSDVQMVGQGNYQIRKGTEWEDVPQEDVDEMFNNLLARPDVQASLNQQGDISTYNLTDDQISESIGNSLYGDPEDGESTGIVGAYEKLVASGKKDKETIALMEQYEELIEEREALLGDTETESSEELINKRRAFAKNDSISRELDQERGAAHAKYVRHNVDQTYIEEWDKKYLIDYKIAKEKYIADIQVNRGKTQVKNAGGDNLTDINSYITNQKILLDGVAIEATKDAVKAGHIEKGTIITLEQIMSGDLPEGMSDDVKKAYKKSAVAIQTEMAIQGALIRQAEVEVGGTSEIINQQLSDMSLSSFLDKDQKMTGGEFLKQARIITGNPNLTYEGLASIHDTASVTSTQERMLIGGLTEGDEGFEAVSLLVKLNKIAGPEAVRKMSRSVNKLLGENKEKINAYLKTNSTREVGGLASPVMPGLNSAESQANSAAIKGNFEKKPLPEDFNIYYDGQIQKGTGTLASLIEDSGWDDAAVIVTDVKFDTAPFMGEPTTAFTVKGMKDNKVVHKTITVPASNFKQSGLEQYFNTPTYTQASEVNLARHSGLDGTTITYSNGVSLEYQFKTGGNSSSDLITIVTDGGTDQETRTTISPTETKVVNGKEVNYLSYIINQSANNKLTYTTNLN